MGPAPAFGRPAAHASQQRRRIEPDLAERGPEECVVLEAVAAAPAIEKFPFEMGKGETDPPAAALDRKVFKQKGLAVGDMETAQRDRGRLEVTGNAGPSQVGVKPTGGST